jgi:hypothetical protein
MEREALTLARVSTDAYQEPTDVNFRVLPHATIRSVVSPAKNHFFGSCAKSLERNPVARVSLLIAALFLFISSPHYFF